MISQYKNIDTNVLKQPVVAQRFNDKDLSLLSYARNGRVALDSNVFNGSNFRTELHIYAADEWITGNHAINTNRKTLTNVLDVVSNKTRSLYNKTIEVDLYSEFEKLNLTRGEFTVVLNFFKNILGSYENQYIRVSEISPDRTEIRLEIIDDNNPEFLTQITSFIQNVIPQQKNPNSRFYTYLLNFSRNKTATFINSVVTGTDGNTQIYLKLYEPLDASIEEKDKCWLVQEDKQPYVDQVVIRPEVVEINTINKLSGPNWEANTSLHTSAETNLKNWNELLGSSIPTSQQIINAYFSGSIIGDELNIDFSDFNNFIFYSSATERIKNFKYKIELLEYYNQQYSISLNTSGSIAQNNAAQYQTNTDNLIGGFDNFERYLYYDSSSALFTHNVPLENANVVNITGSYVQPWPKSNSTNPYTLYSATSSIAELWYNGILDSASIYDAFNPNSLQKTIPEYIRINEDNEQLDLFVAMLGHHYDIIYTYINHVSRIHKRDEHPKLSMPDELLYSVAKQFGWTLNEGNQYTDLWQYVLGTNESGTFLTGSNSVNNDSISSKKMTRHVWRRIVNNLPHLLKTKGTKRSIKALLSCYGIPQSMISINEYGGPRLERPPVYEKLNFDYALDLIQNTAGTVTVDYNQPINSVELRFRTDDVIKNPSLPSTMNLFSIDSNNVTLDFTRGTLGTIQINQTASADIEMFDGGWLNVLLRSGSNGSLEVIAKKSKYGKIVAAVSASATSSFAAAGTLTLGGTVGGSRLQGQLQELRLWSSSLQDTPFNNHTKAPAAYDGNVDAYDELVFRLPLTQKINHTVTSSLQGVEPNVSGISASFSGWSTSQPYDSIEETYYYDGISLAAGTFDDNKVRIENNDLISVLNTKTRAERSQFDTAPLDSKKLGVYFSPQTMINEDIIAQFGFTELDSYIGDPSKTKEKSYTDLIQIAQSYWKKYETKNDINSYIKIFTLFDLSFFKQLEQLLPARVERNTGLLIQPNILERSKDVSMLEISRENVTYETDIVNIPPTTDTEYQFYTASIRGVNAITSSYDPEKLGVVLRKSNKYESMIYNYQYLFFQNGLPVTGSSPYWLSEATLPIYSSSINTVNDISLGSKRHRYIGSKMSSTDFNVDSNQTIDGGPVVEIINTNPNQLIYTQQGNNGNFRIS